MLVKPLTVHDVAPVVVHWKPPGDEVTVYPVIAVPPLSVGAVQLIDADASPPVAITLVGAPGTVTGITGLEALETALVPLALVAVTVKI